jgi:hypothetical protein
MRRDADAWVIAFDEAAYRVSRSKSLASEALRLAEDHVRRVDGRGVKGGT